MEKIVKIKTDEYIVPEGWEVKMICPEISSPGNHVVTTQIYAVLKSIDNPNDNYLFE